MLVGGHFLFPKSNLDRVAAPRIEIIYCLVFGVWYFEEYENMVLSQSLWCMVMSGGKGSIGYYRDHLC